MYVTVLKICSNAGSTFTSQNEAMTKRVAFRQGGVRSVGRSVQVYVTEYRLRSNAGST